MDRGTVNVARFLVEQASSQPGACAVKVPMGRTREGRIDYRARSFSQLEEESNRAALWFSRSGIDRGTRVLVMVKPGLELIVSVFALFKMGAVPVVIDPGMGLRSFLRCVARTRPTALVGIPLAVLLSRFFPHAFQHLRSRVSVGGSRWRAELDPDGRRPPAPAALVATRADELAAILFTSGSTGPAKGVCYTHGMFEAQVGLIREAYRIRPGEVDLPMLPVFALFNPALGMTTIVPEINPSRPATADPQKIVQAIHQESVTNSFGSPVLWHKVAHYCEQHRAQLPSLRRILMAGSPVPVSLMRRFRPILPHGEIHTPYGATEALPVTTISASEVLQETAAPSERGAGTCVGRPLPGVQVRLIPLRDHPVSDWDQASPVDPGSVGEILVAGGHVTESYDALPEQNSLAKVRDPEGTVWHRMGDLGYQDPAGRIWFCGRKAERVQSADGRLFLTDCCEAVFNRHPKVFRTALVGLGPRGRQTPAIVVQPDPWIPSRSARLALASELQQLALAHPTTAPIRVFFFHPAFPVDVRHNSKIHRLQLARWCTRQRPITL